MLDFSSDDHFKSIFKKKMFHKINDQTKYRVKLIDFGMAVKCGQD